MDSRQDPAQEMKKKRGRPPRSQQPLPGLQQKRQGKFMQQIAHTQKETRKASTQTTIHDEEPGYRLAEETLSPLSTLLQTILLHDRATITRAARDMEVSENTIYRWMNGNSEPRVQYLKRLPDIFPEYRSHLISVISAMFPGMLDTNALGTQEIQKEIYQRVIDLIAANDDVDIRIWQVCQAIFEHALMQMDPQRQGLAITYASLMPAHDDGIHSLREIVVRGHAPWPHTIDAKVYLGSTTLAGAAVMLQRMRTWSAPQEERILVEVDEFEHSACAVPIMRGRNLAGVVIISSAQLAFFKDTNVCHSVSEYTKLLSVAFPDDAFQSVALLNLHPMPAPALQRDIILHTYVNRILTYVRMHSTSRHEAELKVQHEMELEFEAMVSKGSMRSSSW